MLDLITWAVNKTSRWTHLIFLSEQHLPLVDHATIRRSLEPNTSYLTIVPFDEFHGVPKADISHRISSEYVEVPGVGGFHVRPGAQKPEDLRTLHHGSQWMILTRPLCKELARNRNSPFWDRFRATILADELAIQTWVAQFLRDSPHRGRGRNFTLVAAPIDGGNNDMTFTDAAFFSAVSRGFLFIRKRPDMISDAVREHLHKTFPKQTSVYKRKSQISSRLSVAITSPMVDAVFLCLNAVLAVDKITLGRMPVHLPGPLFFGMVSRLGGPFETSVMIVSGDLQTLKVAAMSRSASEDYAPGRYGPYDTTLVKVRGFNLWHHREVHVGNDLNGGIVTISSILDLAHVARVIQTFMQRVLTLERAGGH